MKNPKLEGSNLFDCKSQEGLCPRNCNQCYYNHLGEENDLVKFGYSPMLKDVEENGIVRVNSMHDSNLNRKDAIAHSQSFKRRFFNTSIPNFDFPDPVVYTANCSEEEKVILDFMRVKDFHKIMFVRLRVSSTNIEHVRMATGVMLSYSDLNIVWTMMKYYSKDALPKLNRGYYELKKVLKHDRYTPTRKFKEDIQILINKFDSRRLALCGTIFSELCKDCRNCETYYYQTKKRMNTYNL